MPKRYEDEIRDILKGLDNFPGEVRQRRRWSMPAFGGPRGRLVLDPQRIMGGALILMLFAWILRAPWMTGYPWLLQAAGYISIFSIVLFVVALFMIVRRNMTGGRQIYAPTRWRGQVIEMPRRGGPINGLRMWWRRLRTRFSRGQQRRPGARGRDSFQW